MVVGGAKWRFLARHIFKCVTRAAVGLLGKKNSSLFIKLSEFVTQCILLFFFWPADDVQVHYCHLLAWSVRINVTGVQFDPLLVECLLLYNNYIYI